MKNPLLSAVAKTAKRPSVIRMRRFGRAVPVMVMTEPFVAKVGTVTTGAAYRLGSRRKKHGQERHYRECGGAHEPRSANLGLNLHRGQLFGVRRDKHHRMGRSRRDYDSIQQPAHYSNAEVRVADSSFSISSSLSSASR